MKLRLGNPIPAIMAAITAMAAIASLSGCAAVTANAAAETKTSTSAVRAGSLVLGLTADGKVTLPVTPLNFEVEGIITKLYAKTGDTVKAGQLLAELDDTDYQLKVKNAQNALDKAQSNYDTAVRQRDYSLQSDNSGLESLRSQLNKPFDDYSHNLSIYEAQKSLDRKKEALVTAQETAADPFDPYSYQNSVDDAKINLDKREKELAQAQADYEDALNKQIDAFDDHSLQNSVNEAKISLDRKKADLEKANAKLADVIAETSDPFDDYTYKTKISEAELAYTRKYDDYSKAMDAYWEAVNAYSIQLSLEDEKGIADAKAAVDKAKDALDQKQRDLDDATASINKANEELARAASSYRDNAQTTLDKDLSAAKDSVESAQKAVDDAQRNYDNAVYNLNHERENYITTNMDKLSDSITAAKKTLESAQTAKNDAERSYNKAIKDMENARVKAVKDAATNLKNAETAVIDAQDSLNKAKNDLVRAKADYATQKQETQETYNLKALSVENSNSSDRTITDALFAIEEAKIALTEAENSLAKTKLYASIDGQIISVSKSEGERATASVGGPIMNFGTSSGSGVITLCDTTEIFLSASVSESDIVGLKAEQVVNVTIDSIGDEVFKAKVYNISNIPTTDSNGITTYSVTVRLDELTTEVRDGMNALMNFVKKELDGVLIVPVKAVFIEDNKQYVNVVLPDGSYEKREVVTGLSNGTEAQVVKGLSEGDTVVVGKVKT